MSGRVKALQRVASEIMIVSPSIPACGECMTSDYKQRLKDLLQRKSIVWGKVRLASGQESDYYFDCKLTTLDPEGAFLTGYAVLDLLEENGIRADAIGGPPIGAHPIVAAVAAGGYFRARERKGRPPPPFFFPQPPQGRGVPKKN